MPEPPIPRQRSRIPIVGLVTLAAGGALLAVTLRQVGWTDVARGIASVGWAFLPVLALGAARMAFRARAWMACAAAGSRAGDGGSELPFGPAFTAVIAGDAAGNLTPLGVVASEATKVLLTRARLSMVASLASVTIENVCYTASVVVVLLAGTWLFMQRADVPVLLERAAEVVVVGALAAGAAGLWMVRVRPALLSRAEPLLARLVGRAAPTVALREVELRIYDMARWPASRLLRIGAWEAAFHAAAVLEVWLVVRLLPGGQGASLENAFLLESAGRFVTVAFKFIPYRLGVDEAGSGAVAQALGLDPVMGVTLALVRRLRILALNAVGLLVLARR